MTQPPAVASYMIATPEDLRRFLEIPADSPHAALLGAIFQMGQEDRAKLSLVYMRYVAAVYLFETGVEHWTAAAMDRRLHANAFRLVPGHSWACVWAAEEAARGYRPSR